MTTSVFVEIKTCALEWLWQEKKSDYDHQEREIGSTSILKPEKKEASSWAVKETENKNDEIISFSLNTFLNCNKGASAMAKICKVILFARREERKRERKNLISMLEESAKS